MLVSGGLQNPGKHSSFDSNGVVLRPRAHLVRQEGRPNLGEYQIGEYRSIFWPCVPNRINEIGTGSVVNSTVAFTRSGNELSPWKEI